MGGTATKQEVQETGTANNNFIMQQESFATQMALLFIITVAFILKFVWSLWKTYRRALKRDMNRSIAAQKKAGTLTV